MWNKIVKSCVKAHFNAGRSRHVRLSSSVFRMNVFSEQVQCLQDLGLPGSHLECALIWLIWREWWYLQKSREKPVTTSLVDCMRRTTILKLGWIAKLQSNKVGCLCLTLCLITFLCSVAAVIGVSRNTRDRRPCLGVFTGSG